MDKKTIEYFRVKLESMANEILEGVERTRQDMTVSDETYPDPTDRACAESNRNFELRIRDRERKLLSKIQEAQQRIEDGDFGVCEKCGEEIGKKRLDARPVTTLCVQCKTAQEKYEKEHGQ